MTEWHEIVRGWAAVFVSAALLLWTIFWSRRTVAKSEQGELISRLARVEDQIKADERLDTAAFHEVGARLLKVEEEIKHLPTKEQVHNLQLSIGDLKGDMREVTERIRPLAATVERINDFLMDQGKKV